MDKKYWLKICEEIGERAYSEVKKITEGDRVKVLRKGFGGDETLVMDDRIETIAFDAFKKTGEDFVFVSEECGRKVVGKNPKIVVVIDPLDGSDNFMHKIPNYGVSIAVASSEELESVEVAYVRNLVTGDAYTALKNDGAYKNGEKIAVSRKDSNVLLVEYTRRSVPRIVKIIEKYKTRKLGCVCLTICFVAEGLIDSCTITGLTRNLDVFAGYLIAKEAGAIITSWEGAGIEKEKLSFDANLNLVASSNKEIHSKIIAILGDAKGWVVWITGLPGSGKTLAAKDLLKILEKNKISAQHIELDAIRKILAPEPKYDEAERDYVYRSLVLVAKFLSDNGTNIIMDACGHKKVWRDLARSEIKNFLEVYLKCPIDVCMERETSRKSDLVKRELYRKAKERLKTGKQFEGIGQVPGVDVTYEEPEHLELTIESDKTNSFDAAEKIFEKIKYLNLGK